MLVDAGWWNAARLATGAECSEFVGGRNMAGVFCCREAVITDLKGKRYSKHFNSEKIVDDLLFSFFEQLSQKPPTLGFAL